MTHCGDEKHRSQIDIFFLKMENIALVSDVGLMRFSEIYMHPWFSKDTESIYLKTSINYAA